MIGMKFFWMDPTPDTADVDGQVVQVLRLDGEETPSKPGVSLAHESASAHCDEGGHATWVLHPHIHNIYDHSQYQTYRNPNGLAAPWYLTHNELDEWSDLLVGAVGGHDVNIETYIGLGITIDDARAMISTRSGDALSPVDVQSIKNAWTSLGLSPTHDEMLSYFRASTLIVQETRSSGRVRRYEGDRIAAMAVEGISLLHMTSLITGMPMTSDLCTTVLEYSLNVRWSKMVASHPHTTWVHGDWPNADAAIEEQARSRAVGDSGALATYATIRRVGSILGSLPRPLGRTGQARSLVGHLLSREDRIEEGYLVGTDRAVARSDQATVDHNVSGQIRSVEEIDCLAFLLSHVRYDATVLISTQDMLNMIQEGTPAKWILSAAIGRA